MPKMRLRPGLRSGPHWKSSQRTGGAQRSPCPLAGFGIIWGPLRGGNAKGKGGKEKGRERTGRERRGGERRTEKGRKGRKGEGRRRGEPLRLRIPGSFYYPSPPLLAGMGMRRKSSRPRRDRDETFVAFET